MLLELTPSVSLGQIVFGTSREELRKEFESVSKVSEFLKTQNSSTPTDDFADIHLHVYYSDDLRCKGVEVFPPNQVVLSGKELLGIKFSEAQKSLNGLGYKTTIDDSGLTCSELHLGLYSPDHQDNSEAVVESVYATNEVYPA